ncbi:MAG: GntR family transcriptional regulator [Adlercreutzia sp.]
MNPLASFELDYNSGLPVWIQVKNRIAYLIGSGEYKAGDQLPTVRSLAVDLDISYNTVNRAYMDLEREGYISTRKEARSWPSATPWAPPSPPTTPSSCWRTT